MKEIKSEAVENYVMNDMVWKVDLPRLLKEIAECSKNIPYPVAFTILARVLGILAERAIEINDPALNIIMMHLGLYEGVHDKNAGEVISQLRKLIADNKKRGGVIMMNTKIIEKLERLDDATILRRLPDNERSFFEYGFQRGYNRAINDFLKDLWHQTNKEPEGYDEWILLHYKVGNYYSLAQVKDFKSWKGFVEKAPIEEWLYIDDLFKKEGGENKRA